jgi:ribosomal protein L11 methyltransferase
MLVRGFLSGALHRLARASPASCRRGVSPASSCARSRRASRTAAAAERTSPVGGRGFRGLSGTSARRESTRLERFRARPLAAAALEAAGANDAVDCVRVTRIEGSDVGALSDVLLSLGSTCCTVEDADLGTDAEREVYAGDAKVWHACDVTAMFAPETDIDGVMSDAMDILCAKIEYEKETIPGDDWVNVVLDSFAPTKVADGLWIVPAWTEQTEDQSEGCLNVTLEPGLAFGTGEHPTTRLCLSWLRDETDAFRGGSVLDFGTGSGVLAIGALLMGAARACGVDMEAQSVESAARNAALNGVEANLELFLADGSDGGGALPAGRGAGEEKFDAVVANILVGPVLSLAPLFAEYCAPGGRVCLSGVLTTQTPDVLEAYEPFFEDMTVREENGWAVVAGARRASIAPDGD